MFVFALLPLFFIILLWFFLFFVLNDFQVRTKKIDSIKHLLLIFPHADDEVFSAGGLVGMLSSNGKKITVVLLTKGERGTPNGEYSQKLKEVRTREARRVGKIIGVTQIIQKDFGDGNLSKKIPVVTSFIESLLKNTDADVVITFDTSGLYGHPDHIACSEIVTNLITKEYKHISLWYTTLPKRSLKMIKLPEHMAKNKEFRKRRTNPTLKIFTGVNVIKRIRGLYAYKSQFSSFQKSIPFPFIPFWFIQSLQMFEYFFEVS